MDKVKLGKGFTIFPNRMLVDDRLTASDRSVAIVLYRFANNETGEAYPARATICELAKVSNNTLTKSIEKLVEYGYFTRKTQFKVDEQGNPTKQQLPNIYTAINPRGR